MDRYSEIIDKFDFINWHFNYKIFKKIFINFLSEWKTSRCVVGMSKKISVADPNPCNKHTSLDPIQSLKFATVIFLLQQDAI